MDQTLDLIKRNIGLKLVGKEHVINLLLCALICRGHVLIEDVPGTGKTTLASSLANSLDCSFQRIQFTPDIMPSDITGFSIPDPTTKKFAYVPGALMHQIILADEINRTSPKTQSALLEAMQENQVTIDGKTHPVPLPFMVIATQNPIEHAGTFPLPEAQLDRFFMHLRLGYPTKEEEIRILTMHDNGGVSADLSAVTTADGVLRLQENADAIHVSAALKEYISSFAALTRTHPAIRLGVSTRGVINLMCAAKGYAYLRGRDYATADDVQRLVLPVLAHRIKLTQEARIKRHTPESILKLILSDTRLPEA